MIVERAYDPPRRGDRHLAVAFDLLNNNSVFGEVARRGSLQSLQEAMQLWAAATDHPHRNVLRTFRNKFVAHLSQPPAGVPKPTIIQLFEVAADTAAVWERLAWGTGVTSIALQLQVQAYRESAQAFWRPWTEARTRT